MTTTYCEFCIIQWMWMYMLKLFIYTGVYLYTCMKQMTMREPVGVKDGGWWIDRVIGGVIGEGLWVVSIHRGRRVWMVYMYYVWYLFVDEGECEYYTVTFGIHSWRKESAKGTRVCYVWCPFVEEEECEWYTCVMFGIHS